MRTVQRISKLSQEHYRESALVKDPPFISALENELIEQGEIS